ncbi:MAG: hypothetical protein V7641_1679 [Blastocatellia bacterium]
MTCEEFERVVTDLACEFLIEAATRKRALAHARACSRCAARLQQERALTAALGEAASRERTQAPARMKTALLVAFQQQMTPANLAAPLVSRNESPRRWSRYLMAAAAALMLAAILLALQILHQQSKVESSTNPGPAMAAQELPSKDAASQMNGVTGQASRESSVTNKENVQPAARNDKTTNAPRLPRRRLRPVFRPELANRTSPAETVTEFIPLTAIADATAMHSGTIVRVEMPRASLIAMGLPLNAERARETVKADIVVGDDGLARAIRLVY